MREHGREMMMSRDNKWDFSCRENISYGWRILKLEILKLAARRVSRGPNIMMYHNNRARSFSKHIREPLSTIIAYLTAPR